MLFVGMAPFPGHSVHCLAASFTQLYSKKQKKSCMEDTTIRSFCAAPLKSSRPSLFAKISSQCDYNNSGTR